MNLQVAPQVEQDNLSDEPHRPWRVYVLAAIALLLVLGGFYYFTHMNGGAPVHREAAAPVKVAVAQSRDMAVIENTIGTVVANATVSVTARVQGQLTTAKFKEGDMVKAGQVLFEIDPRPYRALYDNAVATMAAAKTAADRSTRLIGQNAISVQQNETAQAQYLEAKANADAARLNLEFTEIRSPIDGKSGPMLMQPGNLVSVNGTGQPLVSITQVSPIKISFALPQGDLPRIQARMRNGGLTAQIMLHSEGGQDLNVPVDFVSNAVNATNGTIELRATYPNTDGALVPGQLVDVTVQLNTIANAIVVPSEAINTGQDNNLFVYVVTPERVAEMRPVTVQFTDGTESAIQGDVQAGDKVIIDGQLRVIPGAKVSMGRPQKGGAAGAQTGGKAGGKGHRGGKRKGAAQQAG